MSTPLDSLKRNLAAFVQSVMSPVDYFAFYGAKVISQNATDLTLEIQPDDRRLPGMQKVPIRLGIPNATAKVQAGARGLVGFDSGDPQKPFWGPWESATLTELNIGGATQFAALANLVKNEITALRNSFNSAVTVLTADIALIQTHVHPVSGAATGTAPALAALQNPQAPAAVGDVACTLVKIK